MRKFLAYLIPVLLLSVLCGFAADAKSIVVPSYAIGGFDDTDADVFAPQNTASNRLFDLISSDWSLDGDNARRRHRVSGGRTFLVAQIDSAEDEAPEGFISYSMELDEYTSGRYRTLAFGLIAEDCSAPDLAVDITLTTIDETLTARVRIVPGEWNMVYMDISGLESKITGMRVNVNYGDNIPSSTELTLPYLSRTQPAGFRYAEQYSSNHWDAVIGTSIIKSGRIRPDETGQAMFTAPLVTTTKTVPGAFAYFEIHLRGAISGNMTLGILYAGASEEQRQTMKKISLSASDEFYTIPVKADAEIVSYSLSFANLVCEDDALTLESLRVCAEGKAPITGNPDIGTVDSITRSGSSVVFSGILERQAAADFASGELHFYAIPGWSADDLSYAVDLGSIKITTQFQYTVNLASFGAAAAADTFRFFAGIPTDDGILTLSAPRYPDAQFVPVSGVSNMGLYAAASVGVFESNASHVMVELPLDRLIVQSVGLEVPYPLLGASSDTGSFSAGGLRSLSLDEDLLRTLDAEIDFYLSAGIRVYLRLTASSPIPGLTYGGKNAKNYAIRATDNESRQMYAALIRTITSRWNGISGIAIGRGVNYADLVGDISLMDTAVYAADLAEVCRITYNAGSVNIPGISVIVPQVEYMSDESSDSQWISARTLTVMLANKLDEIGQIPWVILYCIDSPEDDLHAPVSMNRMLSDLSLDAPAGLMLFWQPKAEDLTRQYLLYAAENPGETMDLSHYIASRFGELCAAGANYRARAVFLSMASLPEGAGQAFYEYLKTESADDSGRYIYDTVAIPTFSRPESDTTFSLWDFSDKHYTLGWIAGGGVSSCLTDYSDLFSKQDETGILEYVRVLRAEVDLSGTASGAAGITMCNFDERLDFTGIEGLDFTVAVEQCGQSTVNPGRDTVTLVFVIGTEDTRAEYFAKEVKCGEIRSFHCDLSGYDYLNAIDYVGVMVYADFKVNLDIANVSVHSSEMTESDVRSLLGEAGEDQTLNTDAYRLAIILCAVVVVMSVAAIVAITRHENEEERI